MKKTMFLFLIALFYVLISTGMTSAADPTILYVDVNHLNGNGIRLYNYANQNNLTRNNVTSQGWAGVVIEISYLNHIHFNTIQNNVEGLYSLKSSSNNQIYQNNFITNTNHNAYEDKTTNTYDNGSVGNYWSDADNGPYVIQIGNVDNYPSLIPF